MAIGLGRMGSVPARTLLAGGYRLTVWNRTASNAAPLVVAGRRSLHPSRDRHLAWHSSEPTHRRTRRAQ